MNADQVTRHPLWVAVVSSLDAAIRKNDLRPVRARRAPIVEDTEALSLSWGYTYTGEGGRVDLIWTPSERIQEYIRDDLGLFGSNETDMGDDSSLGRASWHPRDDPRRMAYLNNLRSSVENSRQGFVQKMLHVGAEKVHLFFAGPKGTVSLYWYPEGLGQAGGARF